MISAGFRFVFEKMVHIPTAANATRMIGTVVSLSRVGLSQNPCAKIRVKKNVFDDFLSMYFPHDFDYWTFNQEALAKLGDTVLIKPMKNPLTISVKFEIDRIIFRHGKIENPLEKNKKIVDGEFLEMREKRNLLIKELLAKKSQKN